MTFLNVLLWGVAYITGAGVLAALIGRVAADPRPRCVTCTRRIDTGALNPGDAFAVLRAQDTHHAILCPTHARTLLGCERTPR